MDAMRADMGGAATVCASIVAAAALKLPVNIVGGLLLIPFCQCLHFYCAQTNILHVCARSRSGAAV